MSGFEILHWLWTGISGIILVCLFHGYAFQRGRLKELEHRLKIVEDIEDQEGDANAP